MSELDGKEPDEWLQKWAKELGEDLERLREEFATAQIEISKDAHSKGVSLDAEEVARRALLRVHHRLKRERYGAVPFENAICLGRSAPFHWESEETGQEQWFANVVGVLPDLDQIFLMTMTGDVARDASVPLFEPCKFTARVNNEAVGKLYLSSLESTEFVSQSYEMADVPSLVESYFAEYFTELSGIAEYFESIPKDDKTKLVITRGS
ncbi:MAG: hypothetical protein ACXQTL_04810, partial [Methanosarcinales archaeon]